MRLKSKINSYENQNTVKDDEVEKPEGIVKKLVS
jgi:hypothetical protein